MADTEKILNRGFVQYAGSFQAEEFITPENDNTYFTSIEIITDANEIIPTSYGLKKGLLNEIAVTGLKLTNPYLSTLKIEWDSLGEEYLYNIYVNDSLYIENIEHQTLMFEYLMDCGPYNIKVQAVLDGKEVGIAAEDSITITIYSANAIVSTLELTDEDYATIDIDNITDWVQLNGVSKNGATAWVSESILSTFGNEGMRGFYDAGTSANWNISENFKLIDVFAFVTSGANTSSIIIDDTQYLSDDKNIWFNSDCVYINQSLLDVDLNEEKIYIITAVNTTVGDNGTFALKVVGEKTPSLENIEIPAAGQWLVVPDIENTSSKYWYLPKAIDIATLNLRELKSESNKVTYVSEEVSTIAEPVIAFSTSVLNPSQIWLNGIKLTNSSQGYIYNDIVILNQKLFTVAGDYLITIRNTLNEDYTIPLKVFLTESEPFEVFGAGAEIVTGGITVSWGWSEQIPEGQTYNIYIKESNEIDFRLIKEDISTYVTTIYQKIGIYDIKITAVLQGVETAGVIIENLEIVEDYPDIEGFSAALSEDKQEYPTKVILNWILNEELYNTYRITVVNREVGITKSFLIYNKNSYEILIEDYPSWIGRDLLFNIQGIYTPINETEEGYECGFLAQPISLVIPNEINYSWAPIGVGYIDNLENEIQISWGASVEVDGYNIYYEKYEEIINENGTLSIQSGDWQFYKTEKTNSGNYSIFPLNAGKYKLAITSLKDDIESQKIVFPTVDSNNEPLYAIVIGEKTTEELVEDYSIDIQSIYYEKSIATEGFSLINQFTININPKENIYPVSFKMYVDGTNADGSVEIHDVHTANWINESSFSFTPSNDQIYLDTNILTATIIPIFTINGIEREYGEYPNIPITIAKDDFGTVEVSEIDLTQGNFINLTYRYNALQQALSNYLKLDLHITIKVDDKENNKFIIENFATLGKADGTGLYKAQISLGPMVFSQSITFDNSVVLIEEFYIGDNYIVENATNSYELNLNLEEFTKNIKVFFATVKNDDDENIISTNVVDTEYNINNANQDIVKRIYELSVKEDDQNRTILIQGTSFQETFPNILYNYPVYTIQVNITQLGYTGKVGKEVIGYSPNGTNWLDIFTNTPIYNNQEKKVFILEEENQLIQYHYGKDPTDTTFYIRTKDFQNIILFRFDLAKINQDLKYQHKYRLNASFDIETEELDNSSLSLKGYYISSKQNNISKQEVYTIKSNTSLKNYQWEYEFEYDLISGLEKEETAYIMLELEGENIETNYATFVLSGGATITDITPFEIKKNKQIILVNQNDKDTPQPFLINADRNRIAFNNVAISSIVFTDEQDNCLVNCVVSDIIKEGEKGEENGN